MSRTTASVSAPPAIRALLQRHFKPRGRARVRLTDAWFEATLCIDEAWELTLRTVGDPVPPPWMGQVQILWSGANDDWLRFTTWGGYRNGVFRLREPGVVQVPELRAHKRHATVETRAELRINGRSLLGGIDDLSIAGAGLELLCRGVSLSRGDKGQLSIFNSVVGRVEVPITVVSTRPRSGTMLVAVTFDSCQLGKRRLLLNHIWYAADPGRFARGLSAR